METAKVSKQAEDSKPDFMKDDFYENIQAPKWIDFLMPEEPVDDHEWFCKRAGCTHEKKPFCQAPLPSPSAKDTSKSLQTIPEEISMTRNVASLSIVPSFAEKIAENCNGLTNSLFATFFCCFP